MADLTCPMGGPRCHPGVCDCFIDFCDACAAGNCPTGGIHPEFYEIGSDA